MKKTPASFVCLLLVSCSLTRPADTPPPIPDLFATPWEDRTPFQSGLIESQQPVLEELEGASVYHIELNIHDNLSTITGREDVRYTNSEAVELDEVQFRLFPNILGGEMEVSNLVHQQVKDVG